MTESSNRFPPGPAGEASAWLWDAIKGGGQGVTRADLDARFTPSFRERREDYGDPDRFRRHAQVAALGSGKLVEATAVGERSVRLLFDSRGTLLQLIVEVEAEFPHPIKDIKLRLEGGGSLTALDVTAMRAFHYLAHPDWRILDDEYAVILLGGLAEDVKKATETPLSKPMAINTLARHRYAEDRLLDSLENGLDQYVLLGAGLDTSPLRHRNALDHCRVFELDHPDSQAWKLQRFASAGLTLPDNVILIPADLSLDELEEALRAGGFDPQRPSFVSWLGVTYYLPLDAVLKTLKTIATWARGTHVVFDYFLPPDSWLPEMHAQAKDYASFGEPWITWWADDEMKQMLSKCGLETVELVDTAEMIERYAPDAPIKLEPGAVQHIAYAVVG